MDVGRAVARAEGRQGRVPRRQGRHRPRAGRQGSFGAEQLVGERVGADRRDRAGQAGVGQGHLPEEDLDLVDDGSRASRVDPTSVAGHEGRVRRRTIDADRDSRRKNRSTSCARSFGARDERRSSPTTAASTVDAASKRCARSCATPARTRSSTASRRTRCCERAAAGAAGRGLDEHFKGPTAVAISFGDPAALAKMLVDYAKDNGSRSSCAARSSTARSLDPAGIAQLATLPSLDELRGKLIGTAAGAGEQARAARSRARRADRRASLGATAHSEKAFGSSDRAVHRPETGRFSDGGDRLHRTGREGIVTRCTAYEEEGKWRISTKSWTACPA